MHLGGSEGQHKSTGVVHQLNKIASFIATPMKKTYLASLLDIRARFLGFFSDK